MNEKFVQVGLRKKGRIAKNEQFTIRKFVDDMLLWTLPKTTNKTVGMVMSFFQRLSSAKVTDRLTAAYNHGFQNGIYHGHKQAMSELEIKINSTIDADEFGKKKRK